MSGDGKGLTRVGDWFPPKYAYFWNRTGAALLRGQAAMMDVLGTQAETTTIPPGGNTSVWGNVTPVTQTGYDAGYPIPMCADESIADNALGQFVLRHAYIEAAVSDDDISNTDVDRGDPLAILVSESAVNYCAWVTATTPRALGFAWEDAAATSSDTDRLINASSHRRFVCYTGGFPMAGFSDT